MNPILVRSIYGKSHRCWWIRIDNNRLQWVWKLNEILVWFNHWWYRVKGHETWHSLQLRWEWKLKLWLIKIICCKYNPMYCLQLNILLVKSFNRRRTIWSLNFISDVILHSMIYVKDNLVKKEFVEYRHFPQHSLDWLSLIIVHRLSSF